MKISNYTKFLVFLLVIASSAETLYSQEDSKFDLEILSRSGDLNDDNFTDIVVVKQDTINQFKPFRLEIYFGTNSGEKELIAVTDKAIRPEFPGGKNSISNGEGFSDISIKNKKLVIAHELLRGHKEHFYQFKKGKFHLIEYNFVESDGRGKIYYENIDFNMLTRITKVYSYQEDKIISENEFKLKLDNPQYLEDLNMVPEVHN